MQVLIYKTKYICKYLYTNIDVHIYFFKCICIRTYVYMCTYIAYTCVHLSNRCHSFGSCELV